MNIHLPAILMFTRGTRVLTHCHFIPFPNFPRPYASQSLRLHVCSLGLPKLAAQIFTDLHCITVSWHVKNTEKNTFLKVLLWMSSAGERHGGIWGIWGIWILMPLTFGTWQPGGLWTIRQVRAALHCARDMFERRGSDMDSNGLACQL